MYALYIVACPFVLFRLAIVLTVLPRFTDSDYPFGIFKLFLIKSTKALSLQAACVSLHGHESE